MIGGKLSCYVSTMVKYGAQINAVGEKLQQALTLSESHAGLPISHCQVGYLPPEHTLQHASNEGLSVPETCPMVRHAEYTNTVKSRLAFSRTQTYFRE